MINFINYTKKKIFLILKILFSAIQNLDITKEGVLSVSFYCLFFLLVALISFGFSNSLYSLNYDIAYDVILNKYPHFQNIDLNHTLFNKQISTLKEAYENNSNNFENIFVSFTAHVKMSDLFNSENVSLYETIKNNNLTLFFYIYFFTLS